MTEELKQKEILAITGTRNGICVNYSFISLVNEFASATSRVVKYFQFDQDPSDCNLNDMVTKDGLDRMLNEISNSEFVAIDKRLQKTFLYSAIGFVLSQGKQIGEFIIDNEDSQKYMEEMTLLRKSKSSEVKKTLIVRPNLSESELGISIENAIPTLQVEDYEEIEFVEGNYEDDISDLYILLSYGYGKGMKFFGEIGIENSFIKVITSLC